MLYAGHVQQHIHFGEAATLLCVCVCISSNAEWQLTLLALQLPIDSAASDVCRHVLLFSYG